MKFFNRNATIRRQLSLFRHSQARFSSLLIKKHTSMIRTAGQQNKSLALRAFCTPRGFGNFFPKKGGDAKPSSTEKPKPQATPKTEAPKSDAKPSSDGGNNNNNSNNQNNNDKQKQFFNSMLMTAPLFLFLLLPLLANSTGGNENEITWSKFKRDLLERGRVDYLEVVNKQTVRVHLLSNAMSENDDLAYSRRSGSRTTINSQYDADKTYSFTIGSVDSFERQLEQTQRDLNINQEDWIPVQYTTETNWLNVFFSGPLIYVMLIGLGVWIASRRANDFMANNPMMSKGGPGGLNNIFSITKANVQVLNKGEKVNTKFADVAGLQNAKREVEEFVDFLKNPAHYTKLGAKIPKGALLVGPPGTGKTLLAKAVAGEAECPFFSISGSDFIEMFVGVGPSRVRDLFSQARQNAPCIVFIDEIDAVGRKRGKGGFGGGNDERENTLNQLLVEMDGFQDNSNVVILAGTNRHDILDPALMRPGRFDRQIQVDKPDIKGRIEIFLVHLSKLTNALDDSEIAQRMATLTPGFSGADIANICNEAALKAARSGKDAVEMSDFYYANDRVIGGLEKRIVMSPKERKTIAYHEAGHAVCGWFLEHAEPLLKVTIIPRGGGALGFAQYLPKELQLFTRNQLYDMMCMTLAGRAAEQVFFNEVSTGAADDLNKVTKLAYGLEQIYGMGTAIGNLSYQQEPGSEGSFYRPFSEETARELDVSCKNLVAEAYERTVALITEQRHLVEKLGEQLLKDEQVGHDELVETLGPRPFDNDSYKAYIKNTTEFAQKHGEESVKDQTVRDGEKEVEAKRQAKAAAAAAENQSSDNSTDENTENKN